MSITTVANSIEQLVKQLDNITRTNYLTHDIHPYAAKFIPHIPATLIEVYSRESDTILDPFCGSGTTLLEGVIRNRRVVGLDSNPIAILISKVKTTPLSAVQRRAVQRFLVNLSEKLEIIRETSCLYLTAEEHVPLLHFPNVEHWFQENVRIEVSFLLNLITMHNYDESVSNFLKLCLSSIMTKVSNQDSETRWVAVNKEIKNGYVLDQFIRKANDNLDRLQQLGVYLRGTNPNASIICDDIMSIHNHLKNHLVDLVVTSPPYPNSYDYYLYHKLRMFVLDYNHKTVQRRELGSRNKHSDRNQNLDRFMNTMERAIREIRDVLKHRGNIALVVGDSIIRGRLISMGTKYVELLEKCGFRLLDQQSFDQRRYTRSFTKNIKTTSKQSHILVFVRE